MSHNKTLRCSCGCLVTPEASYGPLAFVALCRDCYDGTEDAGERAHVIGYGYNRPAALEAWRASFELAHDVEAPSIEPRSYPAAAE
jgi:hypothetical protein